MKIIKRSGVEVNFDLKKIIAAIRKANNSVKEEDRLTEEEIETLKTLDSGKQFTLEGSADIEGVTKRRMEAYFEK